MIDIKYYDNDYAKLTTSYNRIIDNTVTLFKYLNVSNINEKFFLYCLLLQNGYFSINNTFEAAEPPYDNSSSIEEGMQIMTGCGVCRNMTTGLFKDIMSKDGKKLSPLYVYGDSKPKGIISKADHVVVIAKDDIHVLMYDSMKAAIFELLSGLNIYSYFEGIDISFPDIPFTTLCSIIKEQLQEKVQYIKTPRYTKEQIKAFLKQAKTIYKSNQAQLDEFRNLNSTDIDNVSHLVLKYKRNKDK